MMSKYNVGKNSSNRKDIGSFNRDLLMNFILLLDVQPHHKMTVEYVPLGDLMYQIRKRQPVLDDDEFGWSWGKK
uniref:Uncharacterized protein n=1 Tax=Romanomermis culicivorax TaxID=13658 RepID=A0A915JAP3_ROMCU